MKKNHAPLLSYLLLIFMFASMESAYSQVQKMYKPKLFAKPDQGIKLSLTAGFTLSNMIGNDTARTELMNFISFAHKGEKIFRGQIIKIANMELKNGEELYEKVIVCKIRLS